MYHDVARLQVGGGFVQGPFGAWVAKADVVVAANDGFGTFVGAGAIWIVATQASTLVSEAVRRGDDVMRSNQGAGTNSGLIIRWGR